MREAESLLKELPLCLRVIRKAHEILLSGVRGEGKSPGNFRRLPNWIGPSGCTPETATFVPIEADKIAKAMSMWERYAYRDDLDRLVQLAILHAEFEALHPFLDGNGRLGRMMVPLFLWQWHLIGQPMFYISGYFESRRDAYYDGLLAVSRDDDWTGWCRFFLKAVQEQAEENLARANEILKLYDEMKKLVVDATRSRYAINALDWIFQYPAFNSSAFVARAAIPERTARRILTALIKTGILQEVRGGSGRKGTILIFPDLLNIAEGRELFERELHRPKTRISLSARPFSVVYLPAAGNMDASGSFLRSGCRRDSHAADPMETKMAKQPCF